MIIEAIAQWKLLKSSDIETLSYTSGGKPTKFSYRYSYINCDVFV